MPRTALRPTILLATGFGAGYAPVAPGTAGSALGVLLFYLLPPLPPVFYAGILVAITLCAVGIAGAAERTLGTKDPPQVVIDEVAGQLIALAFLPAHWGYLLAGFLLFRLFDIAKPWPANTINRHMKGGAGIVLDDVVAGVYANIVLHAARTFF